MGDVLVVGCGMQAFQQLCGFNTLMYYSATLFKDIGFDQPTAVGLIVSGTNFIFTLFALKWIDKIGRRNIMIWTAPGMIFGLTFASICFHCECRSLEYLLFIACNSWHSLNEEYWWQPSRKYGVLKRLVGLGLVLDDLIRCVVRHGAGKCTLATRRII